MKKVLLAAAGTLAATAALADGTTTVPLGPVEQALVPIVVQVAYVVVAAALSFAALKFRQWTGIQIQAQALDRFTKAAQAEAGAVVLKGGDEVATMKVDVGSTMIADILDNIEKNLPGVLSAAGITPDHAATVVAGKLGELQATMAGAPPAAKP
jgi:hypothetical protein